MDSMAVVDVVNVIVTRAGRRKNLIALIVFRDREEVIANEIQKSTR